MNDQMMNRYISVKITHARPMTRDDAEKHLGRNVGGTANGDGYLVEYDGGYQSWSPLEPFKANSRLADGMSFGFAVEAMRKGLRVARKGWNGKGMFIFLREGRKITGVSKDTPMGGDFEALPHICMRTADGKCCVGWLASQTDILADDWYIVDYI